MVLKAHIDPAPGTFDERREPRRAMTLETSGTLPGGVEANVAVQNLSATGMLIETDLPLQAGEMLTIDLPGSGPVDAEIVWQSERLFGCAFAERLSDAALAGAQVEASFGPEAQTMRFPAVGALEPFGTRLNRLRRERSLTLAQVADALDVSKPTVWAWEKGKARPLPERIGAIAEALGVSADDLAEGNETDQGRNIVEDCRQRIAAAYSADPRSIRIMIEV